jgi:hypothetical protein
MQAAMPLRSGKRGSRRRQQLSSQPAAVAVEGRPRLHPTTKLPIPVVNTMEFNGWERQLAFLRADVPFPIIGLDLLRFFGMQVDPSSTEILVPTPSQRSQGGGTNGGGG